MLRPFASSALLRRLSWRHVLGSLLTAGASVASASPLHLVIDHALEFADAQAPAPLPRARVKFGDSNSWQELGPLNIGRNSVAVALTAPAQARSGVLELQQPDGRWLVAAFKFAPTSSALQLKLTRDQLDQGHPAALHLDGRSTPLTVIRADQLDHAWDATCFIDSRQRKDELNLPITCHVDSNPRIQFRGWGSDIQNIGESSGTLVADTDISALRKDEVYFRSYTPPFYTSIHFQTGNAVYSAWNTHFFMWPYTGHGAGHFVDADSATD